MSVESTLRGTWVAQLVNHSTLGLNSGLELRVMTLKKKRERERNKKKTLKRSKGTQIHKCIAVFEYWMSS